MYIFIEVWPSKEFARRQIFLTSLATFKKKFSSLTWYGREFRRFFNCFFVLWSWSWTAGCFFFSPHSQMQQGHVRIEKIRKGRCLWKGESGKGMLIAYGWNDRCRGGSTLWGTPVDKSTSQKILTNGPRRGQPRVNFLPWSPHQDDEFTGSFSCAVCDGCWDSFTISTTNQLYRTFTWRQRKSYFYAVNSFFCLFVCVTHVPLQYPVGKFAIP